MYQVLNSYAVFLNESHQEPEQAKAMSNEAITYYDMYYGMLADEAKDTYQMCCPAHAYSKPKRW